MSDEKVPEKMRGIYDEIIALTGAICVRHLSQEYADLSRRMAAALSRKPCQWATENLGRRYRLRPRSGQLPVR